MDELSPEIKAFLARADQLNAESDEVKQRVRQAVQAGVVAGSLTILGTAGAQSSTGLKAGLSSFAGAKIWLSAVVISGLGATGLVALRPEPAPVSRPAVHTAAPAVSDARQGAPAAALASPSLANEDAHPSEPRAGEVISASPSSAADELELDQTGRARAIARTHSSTAQGNTRGDSLRAVDKGELALLGEASDALASEDAARALSLLAKHRRKFPGTVLRQERAALTLIARCMNGDASARSPARAFLARNTDAILTPRIRRACDVDTR